MFNFGEEVTDICESGHYSWMPDEAYKVHAYIESKFTEGLDVFEGSSSRTVYSNTTFHYCWFAMRRKRHEFIIISSKGR